MLGPSSPVERSESEFDVKSDRSSPIIIQSYSSDGKSCDGSADSTCEPKQEQLATSKAVSDVEMELETPTVVEHQQSDIKREDGNEMTDDSAPEVTDKVASPPAGSTEYDTSPGTSGDTKTRTRNDTFSSEASWVPANLSYCETWLQGVPLSTPDRLDGKTKEMNRRKCQIVQQGRKPVNLRIDTQIANQQPVVRYSSLPLFRLVLT